MDTSRTDASRWDRVQELFWATLDRAPAERADFLRGACGGDEALRGEVVSLLDADAADGDALAVAVGRAAERLARDSEAATWVGRRVGPYEVVERLGQGGMGTVYLAQRPDVAKRVALKVVRAPLGAPDLVARFLRERRVLARLEHPGIARLLDAGATDDGTPWLALEYVPGEPITAYCERHRLDVAARLRLFLDVCDAVAYAHASLVVHRDLKPSNVLVDADGHVKLLDFGIAKLLGDAEDDGGEPTRTGARLLSPDHAAPEQVTGGAITTATDVYALGVLLYELVAGERPYRVAAVDAVRTIVETEPPRPSATARRAGRGERAARALAGDVDAICLRALAKEPGRRYRAAGELARDVTRHLEGRPVDARLPTPGYRLRKFLRRHRAGVAAAAVLLASVLGGLGAALWQARRARAALAESEAVASFLGTLFEASDPNETLGRDVTVRSLLDDGARRVDALGGEPRVRARMLDVMARAYRGLGEPATARRLAERAVAERRRLLGDGDPAVAASLYTLGDVLEDAGETPAAIVRHRAALAIRRRALGDRAPETTTSMIRLARLLVGSGEGVEAEALTREALAARRLTAEADPDGYATALDALAVVLWNGPGRLAAADSLLRAALAVRERAFGPDDPRVERSLVPLASVLAQRGENQEAEALARRALALRTRIYGPDNLAVYYQLSNVAYVVGRAGRWVEAESLYRRVVARYRRAYDGPQPQIAVALTGIAGAFYRRGQLDSAMDYQARAAEMATRLWGPHHPDVALAWHNVGTLQRAQGRLAEAEASFQRAYEGRAAIHGAASPITLRTAAAYAGVIAARGRYAEADTMLRRILHQQRADERGVGRYAAITMGFLASSLGAQRRFAEAESLALGALAYWRAAAPPDPAQRRAAAGVLLRVYEGEARAGEAAALRAAEGLPTGARDGKARSGASGRGGVGR